MKKGGESVATEKKLLDIKDLHVGFGFGDDYFDAVDGVDISLQKNGCWPKQISTMAEFDHCCRRGHPPVVFFSPFLK